MKYKERKIYLEYDGRNNVFEHVADSGNEFTGERLENEIHNMSREITFHTIIHWLLNSQKIVLVNWLLNSWERNKTDSVFE